MWAMDDALCARDLTALRSNIACVYQRPEVSAEVAAWRRRRADEAWARRQNHRRRRRCHAEAVRCHHGGAVDDLGKDFRVGARGSRPRGRPGAARSPMRRSSELRPEMVAVGSDLGGSWHCTGTCPGPSLVLCWCFPGAILCCHCAGTALVLPWYYNTAVLHWYYNAALLNRCFTHTTLAIHCYFTGASRVLLWYNMGTV